MDDVSLCESSDCFSNNVYADVDINATHDDRIPFANHDNCNLTNSSIQTVATATLALPDGDDDDTYGQLDSSIAAVDEGHSKPVLVHDGEVENLYECDTNACCEPVINDSKESLSTDTLSKANKFFTSFSKSLRKKLTQKPSSLADTAVAPSETNTCQARETNFEQAIASDSAKNVPKLTVRLREKLRKLNFVKSRPNSDDEVSSNA